MIEFIQNLGFVVFMGLLIVIVVGLWDVRR